jgi:hypothetical protein
LLLEGLVVSLEGSTLSTVSNFVLLALLPIGLKAVFAITGVILLAGVVAEAILGPELRRKPLEEASG